MCDYQQLQFREFMSKLAIEDPNFLFSYCLSDKWSSDPNGTVNGYKCGNWSDSNSRVHIQHTGKLKEVYAGTTL